jgi:hypothetical protein
VGVLTQKLGTKSYLVAYLKKKKTKWDSLRLARMSKGDSHYYLVSEGGSKDKSHLWMSGERLTKYQATLLESPEVTIKTYKVLNPASLLPSELMSEHTCEHVIVQTYSSRLTP